MELGVQSAELSLQSPTATPPSTCWLPFLFKLSLSCLLRLAHRSTNPLHPQNERSPQISILVGEMHMGSPTPHLQTQWLVGSCPKSQACSSN